MRNRKPIANYVIYIKNKVSLTFRDGLDLLFCNHRNSIEFICNTLTSFYIQTYKMENSISFTHLGHFLLIAPLKCRPGLKKPQHTQQQN